MNSRYCFPLRAHCICDFARHARIILVIVWTVLLGRDHIVVGAEQPGYRRWAIVATKAVDDTGLSDLLTAELSAREGMDLVERQELAAVTAELELSAYLAPEVAGKRLELGRMLRADALILLSLEEREPQEAPGRGSESPDGKDKQRFVKLVISDCRYGARLRLEYLPWTAESQEALCDACVRLVDDTRRRFASGIRQLIGVTHLLSKNLVHDYDHLQTGYAHLLEAALVSFPGVATVELEEARAIGRELDLASEGIENRVVPLFVEGEYEMSSEKPDSEPTVRLSLRVSDGKQVRIHFDEQKLPFAEVAQKLTEVVPSQIVRLAQDGVDARFNSKRQYAMLTQRADRFSQFGAFEHSTGLREAALLLDAADTDQRLTLIGDYLRWHRARWNTFYARGIAAIRKSDHASLRVQPGNAWDRAYKEQATRLHIIAHHVELAVRGRGLNPREADLLVSTVYRRTLSTGLSVDSSAKRKAKAERKMLADELFWRVYPFFPKLDCDLRQGAASRSVTSALGFRSNSWSKSMSPLAQYLGWTRSVGEFIGYVSPAMSRTGAAGDPMDYSRTLDHLFRFLTEVADPAVLLPMMAKMTTATSRADLNGMIAAGRLEAADVSRFYQRLTQTGKPLCKFYGRLGMLSLKLYLLQDEEIGSDAVREVDALLKSVRDSDTGDPDYRLIVTGYEHDLGKLRADVARKLQGPLRQKRHLSPKNPIPAFDPSPQVVFEPIEGIDANWLGLRKCTDDLDVAWSFDTVCALPRRGAVEEIFRVELGTSPRQAQDRIYSAQWDGENLWIACMTSGIWVVAPNGKTVGRVGADQGLPPHVAKGASRQRINVNPTLFGSQPPWPLDLHPIQPGKCIAIGSFGNSSIGTSAGDKRVWFAEVSAREDDRGQVRFDVNVFHAATKASDDRSRTTDDDPKDAFDMAWLTECIAAGQPHRRLLLVGRQTTDEAGRFPLAIDLESLGVSVFPAKFPSSGYNWLDRYGVGKHVVVPGYGGMDLFSPPSQASSQWTRTPLIALAPEKQPSLRPQLVPYQGALYNPGAEWRRIDTTTWQVQKLTDLPLPLRHRYEHYSASAHYGLVAWNTRDRLYRVLIGGSSASAGNLANLYPYVPADKRVGHHEALSAIRGLGGNVDTQWGAYRHRWGRPKAIEWRTITYLPESWTGGDAGLAHLADLYNLRELYVVKANISDEGLQVVGRISSLESLSLVETKATDAGLAHLQDFDELVSLRIEGSAGGREFSDLGLKHLCELPRLERLALYGGGFTDAGLAALEVLPRLQELWVWDTKTTTHDLGRLASLRRGRLRCHQDESRRPFD